MLSRQKPSKLVCILWFTMIFILSCGGSSDPGQVDDAATREISDGVPTLLDLGSTSCVPCQMMEEELERIRAISGDRMTVTFIDINQDQDAASVYGIRVIPTQIFLDPEGTELYRHEGFISAEQMLSKWTELGYDVYESGDDPDAP